MIVSLGYIASAFLGLAVMAKNDIKSKWFNVVGILFFILYGFLIPAVPIIVANAGLLLINLYQLNKLYSKQEQFKLVEISNENNIGKEFLIYYATDINLFFPNFSWLENKQRISFIILRNMELANIFVAEVTENGQAIVNINYTIPKFRDYKVGRFIFEENKAYLQQLGVNEIIYNTKIETSHAEFLNVMGFKKQTINEILCYTKKI